MHNASTADEMVVPGLSYKGNDLFTTWNKAQERVEQLKASLRTAENEMSNAERNLTSWCLPEDAKDGEKFGIWVDGDTMISVTKTAHGNTLELRHRGRLSQRK